MRKKILAAVLLCVTLTACGNSSAGESAPNQSSESQAAAEQTNSSTPANILYADFKKIVKTADAGLESKAQTVAEELAKNEILPFTAVVVPVEGDSVNTGFSDGVSGYTYGYRFSPMIGSIPFMGYVFETADAAAADTLVADLKDKADLRWNVCTSADEMVCEKDGNIVFFVMSPLEFEE